MPGMSPSCSTGAKRGAASEEMAGAIANIAWSRIVRLPNGRQPDNVDRAELEQMLGRIKKVSLCGGEYKKRESCPELTSGSGRVFFYPLLGLHSLTLARLWPFRAGP